MDKQENNMLNAISPLIIETRVLGYYPFASKHKCCAKLYSVSTIIVMILLAGSAMDKLLIGFIDATLESSSQKSTMDFVQIFANLMIISTCIPVIFFIITCDTNMIQIVRNIDNICLDLNFKHLFYFKLRKYARIYAFLVIPAYYLNAIKAAVVWRILAKGMFESSRFCLEGHVLIRSFHFLLEVQMIVLTLAVKYLLLLINEEIKVSIL
jgi:hypothetical protein